MNSSMMKQYICDQVLTLDKPSLIQVYTFLKNKNVSEKLFHQVSDGIKIDLDRVDDHIITSLYTYVRNMC